MKKVLLSIVAILALAFVVRASSDDIHGLVVINKVSFPSQTASIALMTIASPAVDTDYIIQGYCPILFTTTDDSNVACTLTWVDTDGFTESVDVAEGGGFHGGGGADRFLHVKGGTNVQFNSTYNPGSTNNPYNAYVVVVKE